MILAEPVEIVKGKYFSLQDCYLGLDVNGNNKVKLKKWSHSCDKLLVANKIPALEPMLMNIVIKD